MYKYKNLQLTNEHKELIKLIKMKAKIIESLELYKNNYSDKNIKFNDHQIRWINISLDKLIYIDERMNDLFKYFEDRQRSIEQSVNSSTN